MKELPANLPFAQKQNGRNYAEDAKSLANGAAAQGGKDHCASPLWRSTAGAGGTRRSQELDGGAATSFSLAAPLVDDCYALNRYPLIRTSSFWLINLTVSPGLAKIRTGSLMGKMKLPGDAELWKL
jgi:hypothetical protein